MTSDEEESPSVWSILSGCYFYDSLAPPASLIANEEIMTTYNEKMKVSKDNNNEDAVKDAEDTSDDEARQEEEDDPTDIMLEDDDIREFIDENVETVIMVSEEEQHATTSIPSASIESSSINKKKLDLSKKKKKRMYLGSILALAHNRKVSNNNKDEDKSSAEREELVDAEEDVSHTDTLKEGDYYNESVDMVISSKEQPAKPSSIQSGFTTMYKKLDPKKKFESMMLATSTKKEEA